MDARNIGNTAGLIKKVKENPSFGDTLLYPGKQLADFDMSKLKMIITPSGFPSLDELKFLKEDRGELIIIGARPGQGKSGLGFQIGTNIAKFGKTHIFSLEMGHESVLCRQVAITMNKPLDYIQSGTAKSEELQVAKESLMSINCIVDDRSGLNIYQICDAARMQNKKHKTDLIVVDYIQIVATDTSDYSRASAVGKISSALKELSKELNIPIIALSQLNRNSENREDGIPQMSDLKESGQIEQDADVILLIHRPKEIPTTAKIIVAGQCRFIDPKDTGLD